MGKLFEKVRIRGMELPNRLVMPPMVTDYGNEDGTVSQAMIDYYARRAKGGVGLIQVEATSVDSLHLLSRYQLRIDSDTYIPSLKALTQAIHENGARASIQIHHPGRQEPSSVSQTQPVAPSAVALPVPGYDMPRELATEEIAGLVERFAAAAARAKEADFDSVELHGAHSYLICQFLSPLSNRRDDEYGRDTHGRSRFARECIAAVRERVGPDYPICLRISGQEFVEGGLILEDTTVIARLAEEAGADFISVSAGNGMARQWSTQSVLSPKGCLVPLAQEIKQAVTIPVMVAGRINDPGLAEEILERGQADLIAMGRGLLSDPDLPLKAREGRSSEIRRCIACLTCSYYRSRGGLVCLINPEVGMDGKTEDKAAVSRKVLVVGAGPAGLEAARVAALRGHQVTLWEEAPQLGGRWSWLQRKAITERLQGLKALGVTAETGCDCSAEAIAAAQTESVLITARLRPVLQEGISGAGVALVDAVLEGSATVGRRAAVLGGGNTGLEAAFFLTNRGHQVMVLEPGPTLGKGLEGRLTPQIQERLKPKGTRFYTNTRPVSYDGKRLTFATGAGQETAQVDTVVVALGYEEDDSLAAELKGRGVEVQSLPACSQPFLAHPASVEGVAAARRI
ncbi:MAG: FAD-dependent oxidoreductase [Dehalococcoidia bacterium]|jgi:2,4-dienoyl-CoA reductase-like NADH-dependent reductase (Old Yellow Enzyme family)|nr:FAD-dependent oxidoreductase [Dehalococcoidia bacterium]